MARPRTKPKNRDREPGAREEILAALMEGLHCLTWPDKFGQSGPSTIHLQWRDVHWEITVFQRKRWPPGDRG